MFYLFHSFHPWLTLEPNEKTHPSPIACAQCLLGWHLVHVERVASHHPACRPAQLRPRREEEHLARHPHLHRPHHCDDRPAAGGRALGQVALALGTSPSAHRAWHALRLCLPCHPRLVGWTRLALHRLHRTPIQFQPRARTASRTAPRPRPRGPTGRGLLAQEFHGHALAGHRLASRGTFDGLVHPRRVPHPERHHRGPGRQRGDHCLWDARRAD